jgi:hypothetical protein
MWTVQSAGRGSAGLCGRDITDPAHQAMIPGVVLAQAQPEPEDVAEEPGPVVESPQMGLFAGA